jgi:hypothetical protein
MTGMDMAPGTVIDRFEVVRHLGDGGLASVFLVRHRTLDSLHALKLLHAPDPEMYRRFVQEGRVQARIRHPHVVAVTDIVELKGRVGLVMEYVDGLSLHGALADGEPIARQDALRLFGQMCEGVMAAHAAGVLHRDLKPANVLLALNGDHADAKIADFGIAKVARKEGPALTGAGLAMGTPGYMAPEQILDAATVDARADVFSLGAILYELLTGFPVYRKRDVGQALAATLNGRHTRLRERAPGLPESIDAVVERAIASDPVLRHGSVRELHEAVQQCAPDVLMAGSRLSPPAPPAARADAGPTLAPDRGLTAVPLEARPVSPGRSAPVVTVIGVRPEDVARPREAQPAAVVAPRPVEVIGIRPEDAATLREAPRPDALRVAEPPREAPRDVRTWKADAVEAYVPVDRGELAAKGDSRKARAGGDDIILKKRSPFAVLIPFGAVAALLATAGVAMWLYASSAAQRMAGARAHFVASEAAQVATWTEHAATLEAVVTSAKDPRSLRQTVDTWRFAATPPARIEAGQVMVRALGVEAARQAGGEVPPAVDAALTALEARMGTYAQAVSVTREHETGLASDLARQLGLAPEDTVDTVRADLIGRREAAGP